MSCKKKPLDAFVEDDDNDDDDAGQNDCDGESSSDSSEGSIFRLFIKSSGNGSCYAGMATQLRSKMQHIKRQISIASFPLVRAY